MASILFVFLRAKRSPMWLRFIFILANATFAFLSLKLLSLVAVLFSF